MNLLYFFFLRKNINHIINNAIIKSPPNMIKIVPPKLISNNDTNNTIADIINNAIKVNIILFPPS